MKRQFKVLLVSIPLIITGCVLVYLIDKPTQCDKDYSNYLSYMDRVNYVATRNGFGPQPVINKKEYCRNVGDGE